MGGEKLRSVKEEHQIVGERSASSGVSLGVLIFFVRADAVATIHDPSAVGLLLIVGFTLPSSLRLRYSNRP